LQSWEDIRVVVERTNPSATNFSQHRNQAARS
jgi:hypothetical protein